MLLFSSVEALERCGTGEPRLGVVVLGNALFPSLACMGRQEASFISPEVAETSLLPVYLERKPCPKT